MADEVITFRRTELYESAWREPLRTLARRYGVSDVGLRKICLRLRVPLPDRGYWARLRRGRQDRRPPLAPLPEGVAGEIVARRREPPPTAGQVAQVGPPIAVPDELRNSHKLVSEASRLLRGKNSDKGLVHCWGTRCLDIAVSPASLARALRIMNALIRALEERGLQVEVTHWLSYEQERRRGEDEAPSNATRVLVSGEWIQFGLSEKRSVSRPSRPEPPKGLRGAELESWLRWNEPRKELVPTGVLELWVKNGAYGARSIWRDGKRRQLESQLNDFVAHLPLMAEAIKKQREEMLERQREYGERERRRLDEEQSRREEQERTKRFEEELDRWRFARDTRRYVAEIRSLIAASNVQADLGEVEESLRWMEAIASQVDPIADMRRRLARSGTGQSEAEARDAAQAMAVGVVGEDGAEEIPPT